MGLPSPRPRALESRCHPGALQPRHGGRRAGCPALARRLGTTPHLLRRPRLDHPGPLDRARSRSVRGHRRTHGGTARAASSSKTVRRIPARTLLFTKQLLADRGLTPQSFILVQKPYMERRSYATFRKLWPEKQAIVTSPQVSLDEYLRGTRTTTSRSTRL